MLLTKNDLRGNFFVKLLQGGSVEMPNRTNTMQTSSCLSILYKMNTQNWVRVWLCAFIVTRRDVEGRDGWFNFVSLFFFFGDWGFGRIPLFGWRVESRFTKKMIKSLFLSIRWSIKTVKMTSSLLWHGRWWSLEESDASEMPDNQRGGCQSDGDASRGEHFVNGIRHDKRTSTSGNFCLERIASHAYPLQDANNVNTTGKNKTQNDVSEWGLEKWMSTTVGMFAFLFIASASATRCCIYGSENTV